MESVDSRNRRSARDPRGNGEVSNPSRHDAIAGSVCREGSAMNDDLEARLEQWMRGLAVSEREVHRLSAVALPPRGRRPVYSMRVFATVRVALLLIALTSVGLFRLTAEEVGEPNPPDPAAVAGEARLNRCGVLRPGQVVAAFRMAHASDYQLHLPAMLRAPELERPEPAFVIVLVGDAEIGGLSGAAPPPDASTATGSPTPNAHVVCVLVGDDPATADSQSLQRCRHDGAAR